MNKRSYQNTLTGLRALSVLIVLLILGLYCCIFIRTNAKLDMLNSVTVMQGRLDITGYNQASDPPLKLNGDWEYYPGRIATESNLRNTELWRSEQFAILPATDIIAADSCGTYRLLLTIDDYSNNSYALYFPHLKSPIDVFVNGIHCEPYVTQNYWGSDSPLLTSFYIGDSFDASRIEQEIVLTVNFCPGETALFQRSAILGSPDKIWNYFYLSLSCELLMFGVLSLIVVTAFIFMFFLPDHRLMTLITLFDTLLALRITFRLESMMALFGMLSGFVLSDTALLSIQVFLLMAAGMSGAILSRHMFDPEDHVPRRFTVLLPFAYLVSAILFGLRIDWFDRFGVPLVLTLFSLTFLIVFFQLRVFLQQNKAGYAYFQACKTVYAGLVIFFDIINIKSGVSFLPLCAFYALFFLMHVTTRQYDSNLYYKRTQTMNQDLERLIAERTHELEETNRMLEELSIRDPLTKTFNRLYLEQTLEHSIADAEENDTVFHCCMFDLDLFKIINDTYGHDVGDEQLIAAVETADSHIDSNCILTRIGGEEFVILFFRHTDGQVIDTVEKIRYAFEIAAMANPKRTTASFGVVRFECGMRMKDLLKIADIALYRAKNSGRNRVECDF